MFSNRIKHSLRWYKRDDYYADFNESLALHDGPAGLTAIQRPHYNNIQRAFDALPPAEEDSVYWKGFKTRDVRYVKYPLPEHVPRSRDEYIDIKNLKIPRGGMFSMSGDIEVSKRFMNSGRRAKCCMIRVIVKAGSKIVNLKTMGPLGERPDEEDEYIVDLGRGNVQIIGNKGDEMLQDFWGEKMNIVVFTVVYSPRTNIPITVSPNVLSVFNRKHINHIYRNKLEKLNKVFISLRLPLRTFPINYMHDYLMVIVLGYVMDKLEIDYIDRQHIEMYKLEFMNIFKDNLDPFELRVRLAKMIINDNYTEITKAYDNITSQMDTVYDNIDEQKMWSKGINMRRFVIDIINKFIVPTPELVGIYTNLEMYPAAWNDIYSYIDELIHDHNMDGIYDWFYITESYDKREYIKRIRSNRTMREIDVAQLIDGLTYLETENVVFIHPIRISKLKNQIINLYKTGYWFNAKKLIDAANTIVEIDENYARQVFNDMNLADSNTLQINILQKYEFDEKTSAADLLKNIIIDPNQELTDEKLDRIYDNVVYAMQYIGFKGKYPLDHEIESNIVDHIHDIWQRKQSV